MSERCYDAIVSLGPNCSPANQLAFSDLRTIGTMPFDWNLVQEFPHNALSRVIVPMLESDFAGFLDGLHEDSRGKVVSERYPTFEFFHHDPRSAAVRAKCNRWIDHWHEALAMPKTCMLYNIQELGIPDCGGPIGFVSVFMESMARIRRLRPASTIDFVVMISTNTAEPTSCARDVGRMLESADPMCMVMYVQKLQGTTLVDPVAGGLELARLGIHLRGSARYVDAKGLPCNLGVET